MQLDKLTLAEFAQVVGGLTLFFIIGLMVGLLLCIDCMAYGYPVIVSEQGINHSEAKALVYSIPTEYYSHVDRIDFINNPHPQNTKGYFSVRWDYMHRCYKGRIQIYKRSYPVLLHELGHIYWHCELNESELSEEYAEAFNLVKR